jgi:prevent-host-death family protein
MKTVGIRELKQNLSKYIKEVKSGEKIIVTAHKKQVAVITPFNEESDELLELVRRGVASWAGGKPRGIKPRIVSKGKTVSEAVMEDRR